MVWANSRRGIEACWTQNLSVRWAYLPGINRTPLVLWRSVGWQDKSGACYKMRSTLGCQPCWCGDRISATTSDNDRRLRAQMRHLAESCQNFEVDDFWNRARDEAKLRTRLRCTSLSGTHLWWACPWCSIWIDDLIADNCAPSSWRSWSHKCINSTYWATNCDRDWRRKAWVIRVGNTCWGTAHIKSVRTKPRVYVAPSRRDAHEELVFLVQWGI